MTPEVQFVIAGLGAVACIIAMIMLWYDSVKEANKEVRS